MFKKSSYLTTVLDLVDNSKVVFPISFCICHTL